MDTLDVDTARRHTPGVKRVVHLNNAGAALPPRQVTDAQIDYLRAEAAEGGYETAVAAAPRMDALYSSIGQLINAAPDEIATMENATRAWDMAFYAMRFSPGDRILTARAEYASNMIAYLQVAKSTGAMVEAVDDDGDGQLSVEDLEARVADSRDGPVRLIAMTHVPTNSGLVNPAEAVGAVAREAGVPFLLDACQSVGHLPVDVARIGCDMLSATGRKYLRGPRGTGFLYVRRSFLDQLEPPFLDLHSASWDAEDRYTVRPDARRFETWETNCAGKVGLGVAVDYALSWGIDAISRRILGLADGLRQRLGPLPGVVVRDQGKQRCGIVTFTIDGVAAEDVQRHLSAQRINTTVSLPAQAGPYLARRGLEGLVRASVHYYNTEEELDRLVDALPVAQPTGPRKP